MAREFLTPVALNADPTDDTHATRRGWVNAQLAGKVGTGRSVLSGTGLTGGGDLSADRTLAVAYGSGAGTAVQGNDARVTADQVAGTASIRTLGTGSLQAAAGDDARFTGAVAYTRLPVGTAINTVAAGDDARITGAVPSTRSVISGTGLTGGGTLAADRTLVVSYGSGAGTAVQGNDTRVVADQAAATASIRTLGTGALQACAGNDGRLSDARTPTAHVHAGADISTGTVAYGRLPIGTAINTVAAGDDSRITGAVQGARLVSAGTGLTGGGDLTADRSFAVSYGSTAATAVQGNDTRVVADQAAITASIRTLGTGALQAAAGNHTHAYVPTTRLVSAGTGLTGGGDLSADRTLTVSYGSGAGTAVQGNDARVTADQVAGTASIRTLGTGAQQAAAGNDSRFADAAALTTGTVATARLPNLLSAVRTVAPSAGTISINADTAGDNVDSTLTADATLNVPTNGASGQAIQGTVLASAAQRVLTFHASYGRLAPVVNTLTIPSGKVGRYSIRRTDITGAAKWLVEAAGVEQ